MLGLYSEIIWIQHLLDTCHKENNLQISFLLIQFLSQFYRLWSGYDHLFKNELRLRESEQKANIGLLGSSAMFLNCPIQSLSSPESHHEKMKTELQLVWMYGVVCYRYKWDVEKNKDPRRRIACDHVSCIRSWKPCKMASPGWRCWEKGNGVHILLVYNNDSGVGRGLQSLRGYWVM